ncbi:hypothetical protein [Vreelandella subterranea]|uniref:hypothetical protein n=1 Tax=Vreelandella subterranea TaxID=416874 RepID=UPI001C312184|nr:hypothetical protein [Halomonas subterranea]
MKTIALLGVVVLLSGCSTSPVSSESANPVPDERLHAFQDKGDGNARFVVTRDNGFFGSGCRTDTAIDGKHAAEIGPGETAGFYLKPGRHIVGINSRGVCMGGLKEAEFVAREGDETRYRISIDSTGSMDISPTAY